ncbi:MAG: helix-turn-helix transcriptional regulator [Pseudomonadota bacterium]
MGKKTDNPNSFGAILGREMKSKRAKLRLTQGQLAAQIWPGDETAEETRKADISKLENGKVPNPHTTTVKRVSDVLGFSDGDIAKFRHEAALSPAQRLEEIPTLSRDQLELLASRFEIERPHEQSDAALREVLTKKAEEYRSFRAQIDGLDERVAAIANLKGAAADAAERLDFDEVEDLLSRVDEVETEIAAETKVARADNALLRGRVDEAFRILSAAADSFASVDPVEPARKRLDYGARLYHHGLGYGGDGLTMAAQIWSEGLAQVSRETQAEDWGKLQNNLAVALQD